MLLAGSVLGVRLPAWGEGVPPMVRMEAVSEAPAFVLTNQDGRRFRLQDLTGKAVLMAFIYTSCPDVCPLIYGAVTSVRQRVKAEDRNGLVCVFVTTDPEVDTPEVLNAYAARRGADPSSVIFLTGSPEELQAVWEGFGVRVTRRARGLVDHTPLTVLIDRRGVIRYRYLGGVLETDTIAADSRKILKEEVGAKKCH